MANTTNFGWETPDDTDLVKDGAAAIRTLGQAIDTSLQDLEGGTTNQVLAKNSNTDMDFKWVADASGIPATIFDAKGDLIVASGADTAARLAVGGTNGHVLTVASGATNGIEWAAPAGGGKVLQVVQGEYTTSTTVATTTYTDTGLSLAITPSSATSKILVMINQSWNVSRSNVENGHSMKIFRGATEIYDMETDYRVTAGYVAVGGATAISLNGFIALTYLDSPATTSSTTYKTQGAVENTSNSGQAIYQNNGGRSIITLMEIGA
jgi:hypothetical protein